VLGRSALAIVERAAGLLLVAIAVQFILDGVGEALPGVLGRDGSR
jgi:multiple antibiotic resistance protein